jgi:hypothetical protein
MSCGYSPLSALRQPCSCNTSASLALLPSRLGDLFLRPWDTRVWCGTSRYTVRILSLSSYHSEHIFARTSDPCECAMA